MSPVAKERNNYFFISIQLRTVFQAALAPTYLYELLRYTNGPRLLRSSSQNFLAVPRTRLKTYGDRAFSAAAPRLWNQLPPELRSVTAVDQFRTQLKTYLFKLAYDV